MLAIVNDKQRVRIGPNIEQAHDLGQNLASVPYRREINPYGAVGEPIRDGASSSEGKTRLTNAGRPSERDEPRNAEQLAH